MIDRRHVLASFVAVLAGCTTQNGTSDDQGEEPKYSMDDLRIKNQLEELAYVIVVFTPEGESDLTLDLTTSISSNSTITWEDIPPLGDKGTITARVDAPNMEKRDEIDWPGDPAGDNYQLLIVIENGSFDVEAVVQ